MEPKENTLESAMNMSQEEIERLLEQHTEQKQSEKVDLQDSDLDSLLTQLELQDDSDIQEISELLVKAEQNKAVDEQVLSLMKSQEEDGQTAYDAMDLFSGETVSKREGILKKLSKKFKKKEESSVSSLTEEGSIEELSEVKKRKKKSNRRKKEEKSFPKDSGEDAKTENTMDDALSILIGAENENNSYDESINVSNIKNKKATQEASADEEKIKNKKSKKKKEKLKDKKKDKKIQKQESLGKIKEKPTIEDAILELELEEGETPHKNKIICVCLASVLIMIGFLVVNYYFTGHANKRLAEEAYAKNDYLECYQLLYGQELNDSQMFMFKSSECILKTEIFWKDYYGYIREDKVLEGLDELTQYVYQYPKTLAEAMAWNGQEIVENTYYTVQSILTEEYETDIQEIEYIAALESDTDYTRALLNIVQEKAKKDDLNKRYPDMLPEEKDRITEKR